MNKKIYTTILATALMFSTSASAVILSDPLQMPQALLNQVASKVTIAQSYINALSAARTVIANGVSGVNRLMNTDFETLFRSKLEDYASDAYKKIVGDEVSKIFGSNAPNISVSDLLTMDMDAFKKLGTDQIEGLTNDQIKKLLGDQLGSKLTVDQIQAFKENPEKLLNLANDTALANQKKTGLEAVGINKGDLADKTNLGNSAGPAGNRSDAFSGDGNGSTKQAQDTLKAFEEAKTKIVEKLQLPSNPKDLKEITTEKIAEVARLQVETVSDLSARGLAKAWISQAITTRNMEKQEQTATQLINEAATDLRLAIQAVTTITVATVEMQNATASMFAMDLAVVGSQGIQRVGSMQATTTSRADTETSSITDSK